MEGLLSTGPTPSSLIIMTKSTVNKFFIEIYHSDKSSKDYICSKTVSTKGTLSYYFCDGILSLKSM